MRKLFASKNIRIQSFIDTYGDDINIAYTEKLLQRNVFIEFSGVAVSDDDDVSEEVSVSASYRENGMIYSCVLFVSGEVLGPLPVFRIIADAIEFIENCDVQTVGEDLETIATSYDILDKDYENKEYYQNAMFKHTRALELIKKSREHIN